MFRRFIFTVRVMFNENHEGLVTFTRFVFLFISSFVSDLVCRDFAVLCSNILRFFRPKIGFKVTVRSSASVKTSQFVFQVFRLNLLSFID